MKKEKKAQLEHKMELNKVGSFKEVGSYLPQIQSLKLPGN